MRTRADVRVFRAIALAVVCILIAASLTAVISHVLIDALGDVLLAHDSYDRLGHASRSIVVGASLAGFAGLIGLLVAAIGADAFGTRQGTRTTIVRAARFASPVTTAMATIVLATVAVALMEVVDVARAGSTLHDVAAAFGGSLALGFGVIAVVGSVVGGAVSALLRRSALAYETLVGSVRRLILAIIAIFAARSPLASREARPHGARSRTIVRRAAKRGPPPAPTFA